MIYNKEENAIFEAYLSIRNKNVSFLKEAKVIQYDSIDEELFKQVDLKLARSRFALQKDFPFYWRVLGTLKTVLTWDVPTMAVDKLNNIYINPTFAVETLDQDGVTAVLVHECGHIVGLTFFRKGSRDHLRWNVATDYIINRDLLDDGFKLPDSDLFRALLPVKNKNDRWIIPKYDEVDITDWTAERMYQFIKKWEETSPQEVKEDIEDSEKFDEPFNPDDFEDEEEEDDEETPEDAKINVGDVIRDPDTGRYGVVTSIDHATGEFVCDPIKNSEVGKYLPAPIF